VPSPDEHRGEDIGDDQDRLDAERMLSGKELGALAQRMIDTPDPVEKLKIREVLREVDGNKGRASEVLQISYKNLLMKLKEHAIE